MAKAKQSASFSDYTAALNSATTDLPPVIVIEGAEPWLRRNAIDALLLALRERHAGIEDVPFFGPAKPGEDAPQLGKIVSEFTASSLFSRERVILIRQATHLLFPRKNAAAGAPADKAAAPQKNTRGGKKAKRVRHLPPDEMLIEYLNQPAAATWVVIELDALSRQRRVGKALAKSAAVIPCPVIRNPGELRQWLIDLARAEGKTLAHAVPGILIDAHGTQMGTLATELEKLLIYAGEAETVEQVDAELFLTGSLEFDIFTLTNAIEARDLDSAILTARRIIEQGIRDGRSGKKTGGESSAHMALSMLASTITSLLNARVGGAMNTSPWRADKLRQASQRFSLGTLRGLLRRLAEEIHRSHDTGHDVALSLERIVLASCRTG